MAGERQVQTEDRIRAAIDQLLTGNVPEGLKCDVRSLCAVARVPRATLYRAYPHLKAEFELRLGKVRDAAGQPDPRLAQIERLKTEVATLRERLCRATTEITTLEAFKSQALSRIAAQHDEITVLQQEPQTAETAKIRMLRTQ